MGIFLEYLKISIWMAPVILVGLWLLPKLSKRYTAKAGLFCLADHRSAAHRAMEPDLARGNSADSTGYSPGDHGAVGSC